MREKLSHRRLHLTESLTFYPLSGDNPVRFDVSFGFEPGGPVRECFSLDFKVGSDRQGEVHIACIIISVALQCGQSMSDLARIIGESDPGVAPQTMLGLIIRAGVTLDDYLTSQWALTRARDIPKPATEAAAADEVERVDPKGGQPRTYHVVGAEAGQKREPVDARAANVSAGVTAGETARNRTPSVGTWDRTDPALGTSETAGQTVANAELMRRDSRERPAPEQNSGRNGGDCSGIKCGETHTLAGASNTPGSNAIPTERVTGGESAAHRPHLRDVVAIRLRGDGGPVDFIVGSVPLFEGECAPDGTNAISPPKAEVYDLAKRLPNFLRRTSTDGAGA
jgi:hypothetical protein